MSESAFGKVAKSMAEEDPDEKISRRRFIAEMMFEHLKNENGRVSPMDAIMAKLAVAQEEEKHPEWDFDTELLTRAQWHDHPSWQEVSS